MRMIIHATDFSERSYLALRRAALLARETGAMLRLIHVVDDDRPRRLVDRDVDAARMEMDELARSLDGPGGGGCQTEILRGDPFEAIVSATEGFRSDLLVIGAHRRRPLRDGFLGTTAERVVRSCPCAVLVVKALPTGPYRTQLATTDLGKTSIKTLRRIRSLDLPADRRLLLHVFDAAGLRRAGALGGVPDERYVQRERDRVLDALSAVMRRMGGAPFEVEARQEHLPVAHEIIAAAEEHRADLVAVSSHARGGFVRLVLGSVAGEVLRHAPMDVLVVPPEDEADEA